MRQDRPHHSSSAFVRILAAGESNRALLITSPRGGGRGLTLGYAPPSGTQGCVRVHSYRIPPSLGGGGGQSVVLESPSGGNFVSAQAGGTGSSILGVTVGAASPQGITAVDGRFFRIAPSEGERSFLIHMQTGKYVCHDQGGLTLEDATPQLMASGALEFEFFPCEE